MSTATPDAGRACDELALGAGHAVEVAEVLDVCHGDARHDPDVGPGHTAPACDVAEVRARPSRGPPIAASSGALTQGERQAQLVVEGALAGRRRNDADRQRWHEVLRRRLPHRPRDPHRPRRQGGRVRLRRRFMSAVAVSSTTTAVAPTGVRDGQVGRRARCERRGQ